MMGIENCSFRTVVCKAAAAGWHSPSGPVAEFTSVCMCCLNSSFSFSDVVTNFSHSAEM